MSPLPNPSFFNPTRQGITPMKLIGAVLARNEADKFLKPVLTRLLAVCDSVLLLDDNSTDDTYKIAKTLGCSVKKRTKPPMWGQESSARQELWDWAVSRCGQDDWVLVCDADQVLVGDPRPLMKSWEANTVLLRLYDLWTPNEYRCDGFWQAHLYPRAWMFAPHRVPQDYVPQWNERGIHCGHAPANFPIVALHDPACYFLHRAYENATLRKVKYDAYMARSDQLAPHEVAHAQSILDF